MLLGNYSVLNTNIGRNIGGATNLYKVYKESTWCNFYENPTVNNNSSIPSGTQPPYSLLIGMVGGELSTSVGIIGQSTLSGNLAQGANIESIIAGAGDLINSDLSLIVQLACDILGAGDLTADMFGVVQLASDLVGAGDLVGGLNLIANLVSEISGAGDLTADMFGTASMEADIVSCSGITDASVANAVWNSLASAFNVSGTMGELLNDAGGGASPSTIAQAVWDELNTGYTTPDSYGAIITEMELLLKQIKTLQLASLK